MASIKKDNTALYTLTSINNSSTITTNSTVSSTGSEISVQQDTNISFIVENQKTFQKLMDDLSIIDNVYTLFDLKNESNTYGKDASLNSTIYSLINNRYTDHKERNEH